MKQYQSANIKEWKYEWNNKTSMWRKAKIVVRQEMWRKKWKLNNDEPAEEKNENIWLIETKLMWRENVWNKGKKQ